MLRLRQKRDLVKNSHFASCGLDVFNEFGVTLIRLQGHEVVPVGCPIKKRKLLNRGGLLRHLHLHLAVIPPIDEVALKYEQNIMMKPQFTLYVERERKGYLFSL